MMNLFSRTNESRAIVAGLALIGLAMASACSSTGQPGSLLSPSVAARSGDVKPGGSGSTTTPATITFADRAGDAITSNGSPYAAEVLGNSLAFACCTGQLVNYDFSNVISGTGPTGNVSDLSGFFVPNAGTVAIGSSVAMRGYFKTSLGQINFDSTLDAQTSSVVVTRVDAKTWTIETSAGDVGALVQTSTVPDPKNPHKTIQVTSKTYYHLPFKATGISQ